MTTARTSLLVFGALLLGGLLVWLLPSGGSEVEPPLGEPQPAASPSVPAAEPRPVTASDPVRRPLGFPEGAPGQIRVHGRVINPYGEPLGGALVGDAASDGPVATVEDGRFELFCADRSIALLVLAAGHAPLVAPQDFAPGARSHDAGDLQLLRGGGLRGRVQDGSGQGIPGATVTLRFLAGGPGAAILAELLGSAVTDERGGYAFAHLSSGPYRVGAAAPGKQAAQSGTIAVREGSETAVDPLLLAVGHDLSGLVLDPDESPVAGAVVQIGPGNSQGRSGAKVETGADGRFGAASLPPGPLWIEVSKAGFLSSLLTGVDPARGGELVVRLEAGIRLCGIVVDARTGAPVERYAAAIHQVGRLDPGRNGKMAQQLAHRIEELRAEAAAADGLEASRLKLEMAAEFEARLARLDREGRTRPVAARADPGPIEQRPGGRFVFEGLAEGIFTVLVVSPDHQAAQSEPMELRRGQATVELRLALIPGYAVSGTVVARRDGAPIAGAAVELMRVLERPAGERTERRSLFPWVFARSGPQGVAVAAARTDADGRFEFRHAAPGNCFLSIRHKEFADHETEPFVLQGGRLEMRIAVDSLASLRGKVVNLPSGQEGGIEVIVLGGHGTMRSAQADAAGAYRIDGLPPGDYLVRAFPASSPLHASRLFNSIFPLHAGAVDSEKIPPRDVTLAPGETRLFDLVLELPPTGRVEGAVTVNGWPGKGSRAILRPQPGEAPGAGGLPLRAECDEAGRFAIKDVPEGRYTLSLYTASHQELGREPVAVAAGQIATVRLDSVAGGLSGRVAAPDVAPPGELRGYLWVLPGAKEAPADLYEYRNSNPTHRIRIRDGVFADDGLKVGPAVLVVDLRGRKPSISRAIVPAGEMLELVLKAGEREP